MEGYDIALICLNGHTITSNADSSPQNKRDYCERCGAETICSCPNCKKPIKGDYHASTVQEVLNNLDFNPPRFCDSCGESYPWFKKTLELIFEFVDHLDSLSFEQKNDFKGSIAELVKESSKVPVAKVKLIEYLGNVDKDVSNSMVNLMKEILTKSVVDDLVKATVQNTVTSIWRTLRTGRDVQYMNFTLRYKSDELLIMKQQ